MLLNRANRQSNNAVYESLEIEKGDCVLEVGFGGAELLLKIAQHSQCSELCGVEKSGHMVRRAQSLVQRKKLTSTVKLSVGCIETLPYLNNRFDRVCSVNTVYFWSDLDHCAAELARVTADTGKVVLGYGSGEKLAQSGYTENGFRFYPPAIIDQVMANAGLNLQHNHQMERLNKDPFFVSVYGRDEQQQTNRNQ